MKISIDEFKTRAARIKLVLSDCDGVLTDGGVYFGAEGEVLKRFDVRDGMGVARLREIGVETAIITREVSAAVRARVKKLALPHLFEGVIDKAAHLDAVLGATALSPAEIAYIGDDVNDLDVMRILAAHGLTGAPSDAFEAVFAVSHFRCARPGGHGAFRDFAEWIVRLRA